MGLLDGLLGGIPSLLGGIIGGNQQSSAQAAANASNEKINQENIKFQTDMSNTAVQRRAADMQAAGINPILAAGSPASQPSFTPIPMQSTKQGFGSLGSQIGSQASAAGMQAMLLASQKDNLDAQTRKTNADAALSESMPHSAADSELRHQQLLTDVQRNSVALDKDIADKNFSVNQLVNQPTAIQLANTYQRWMNQRTQAEATSASYRTAEAKADAEFWKNVPETKYLPTIMEVVKLISGRH